MNWITEFGLVALGGALGASSRYGVSKLIDFYCKTSLPLATLVVNVSGCLLIGLLLGSGLDDRGHPARIFFGIGFLGALTTFSTFGEETIRHVREGDWWIALINVLANLVICLAAVVAGIALGKRFFS